MHELALCAALRDAVLRIAADRNARSVSSVRLLIGPLSGVDGDALSRAYPLACAGTACADATLLIEPAPVRVHCGGCGALTDAQPQKLACADCGSLETTIVSGDEMLISSVELLFGERDV